MWITIFFTNNTYSNKVRLKLLHYHPAFLGGSWCLQGVLYPFLFKIVSLFLYTFRVGTGNCMYCIFIKKRGTKFSFLLTFTFHWPLVFDTKSSRTLCNFHVFCNILALIQLLNYEEHYQNGTLWLKKRWQRWQN